MVLVEEYAIQQILLDSVFLYQYHYTLFILRS